MNAYVPVKPIFIDTVSPDVFFGLCTHLNAALTDESPCDDMLTRSLAWLKENGHDVDTYERFLVANGGFCDCEVLMNVRGHIGDWLQFIYG